MSDPIVVVVEAGKTIVVNSIQQGPPGPPGSGAITLIAGQNLSGHCIICVNAAGQAVYADKDTPATLQQVLGLTTRAALTGNPVTIIPEGEITEPSWTLNPRAPVYLGNNGQLTQTLPTTGAILQVGLPLSATQMLVNIKMPISLA